MSTTNLFALNFFNNQLNNCKEVYDYVAGRLHKCHHLIISKYSIGLAGSYNELTKHVTNNHPEILLPLIDAGLIYRGQYGPYDSFKERIMFPIRDEKGIVVGFSGRSIPGVTPEDEPKYKNIANNELFNKGHVLYGLYEAIPSIRKEGFVFVVEGFFDVFALNVFDKENVVAPMGTAFTEFHAMLLKKYTNRVCLVYDRDSGGIKALTETYKILRAYKFQVKTVVLPEGHDPDSYGHEFLDLNILDNRITMQEYYFESTYSKSKLMPESQRATYIVHTVLKTLIGSPRTVHGPLLMKIIHEQGYQMQDMLNDIEKYYLGKLDLRGYYSCEFVQDENILNKIKEWIKK